MLVLLALLWGVPHPRLAIAGAGECPSEAAIRQRLAVLLPSPTDEDSVQITVQRNSLLLSFHSADSDEVFLRRIPRRSSCAQQAFLVATLIASWQLRRASSTAEPPPLSLPLPLPPMAAPTPLRKAPAALRWEWDAAVAFGLAGSPLALGGTLGIRLRPAQLPINFRLGLMGLSFYQMPLGSGQASWTRPALALGLGYQPPLAELPLWVLDLHCAVLPALLYGQGSGFARNYSTVDFDVALGGGMQLGRQAGRLRPFFALLVFGWLRSHEFLASDGSPARLTPPRVEVLFSTGIAVAGKGR